MSPGVVFVDVKYHDYLLTTAYMGDPLSVQLSKATTTTFRVRAHGRASHLYPIHAFNNESCGGSCGRKVPWLLTYNCMHGWPIVCSAEEHYNNNNIPEEYQLPYSWWWGMASGCRSERRASADGGYGPTSAPCSAGVRRQPTAQSGGRFGVPWVLWRDRCIIMHAATAKEICISASTAVSTMRLTNCMYAVQKQIM